MKNSEKNLLGLFGRLAPAQQHKLMAFAEFLASGASSTERAGRAKPAILPRPARESLTMAIRRLVRSYPMLDRRKLMTEASRLMAQHVIGGRPAVEIIDELEKVFAQHYQSMQQRGGRRDEG